MSEKCDSVFSTAKNFFMDGNAGARQSRPNPAVSVAGLQNGSSDDKGTARAWTPFTSAILAAIILLVLGAGAATAESQKDQLDAQLDQINNQADTIVQKVPDLLSLLSTLHADSGAVLVADVAVVHPGDTFDLPLRLVPGTFSVASIQGDILISTGVVFVSAATGPASTAAGKSISSNSINGAIRILDFGLNQTPIDEGIIATVKVRIPGGTRPGEYPIVITNPVASDPNGQNVRIYTMSGGFEVIP